jgi:hypothetical protein
MVLNIIFRLEFLLVISRKITLQSQSNINLLDD